MATKKRKLSPKRAARVTKKKVKRAAPVARKRKKPVAKSWVSWAKRKLPKPAEWTVPKVVKPAKPVAKKPAPKASKRRAKTKRELESEIAALRETLAVKEAVIAKRRKHKSSKVPNAVRDELGRFVSKTTKNLDRKQRALDQEKFANQQREIRQSRKYKLTPRSIDKFYSDLSRFNRNLEDLGFDTDYRGRNEPFKSIFASRIESRVVIEIPPERFEDLKGKNRDKLVHQASIDAAMEVFFTLTDSVPDRRGLGFAVQIHSKEGAFLEYKRNKKNIMSTAFHDLTEDNVSRQMKKFRKLIEAMDRNQWMVSGFDFSFVYDREHAVRGKRG